MGDTTISECRPNVGQFSQGYNNYLDKCVPNNPIYKDKPFNYLNDTINFKKQFDDLKALAEAEVTEVEGLINSMSQNENMDKYLAQLQEDEKKMKEEVQQTKEQVTAIDTEFAGKRGKNLESSGKPYLIVMQDYILAALAFSYLFFSLTSIMVLTKQANYSISTFMISLVFFVFLGLFIYSMVTSLA